MNKRHKVKNKSNTYDNRENRTVRIILIGIIVLSLGIMIGMISFTLCTNNNHTEKIITYRILNTSVEVVNYNVMGLNGDIDAVKFGRITAGNRGKRFLNISTNVEAVVTIYLTGKMSNFISVQKNNFVLEQGTSELVPISLDIPSDTPPGNYSGEIHIQLSRP